MNWNGPQYSKAVWKSCTETGLGQTWCSGPSSRRGKYCYCYCYIKISWMLRRTLQPCRMLDSDWSINFSNSIYFSDSRFHLVQPHVMVSKIVILRTCPFVFFFFFPPSWEKVWKADMMQLSVVTASLQTGKRLHLCRAVTALRKRISTERKTCRTPATRTSIKVSRYTE